MLGYVHWKSLSFIGNSIEPMKRNNKYNHTYGSITRITFLERTILHRKIRKTRKFAQKMVRICDKWRILTWFNFRNKIWLIIITFSIRNLFTCF